MALVSQVAPTLWERYQALKKAQFQDTDACDQLIRQIKSDMPADAYKADVEHMMDELRQRRVILPQGGH